MPTLPREERETIITFDETPDDAIVFTYNPTWQRHIEKRLGIKPSMINGHGGREYHVPKSRIKPPRAPRQISAATMARLRQQGKTLHQKSSVLSRKGTVQPKAEGKTSPVGKTINGGGHHPKTSLKKQ